MEVMTMVSIMTMTIHGDDGYDNGDDGDNDDDHGSLFLIHDDDDGDVC